MKYTPHTEGDIMWICTIYSCVYRLAIYTVQHSPRTINTHFPNNKTYHFHKRWNFFFIFSPYQISTLLAFSDPPLLPPPGEATNEGDFEPAAGGDITGDLTPLLPATD